MVGIKGTYHGQSRFGALVVADQLIHVREHPSFGRDVLLHLTPFVSLYPLIQLLLAVRERAEVALRRHFRVATIISIQMSEVNVMDYI